MEEEGVGRSEPADGAGEVDVVEEVFAAVAFEVEEDRVRLGKGGEGMGEGGKEGVVDVGMVGKGEVVEEGAGVVGVEGDGNGAGGGFGIEGVGVCVEWVVEG